MHWSRWGDPAQAAPLPASAFDLVDAFIGTTDTPAVDPGDVRLSEPLDESLLAELRGIVGDEHVLTDHETRLHRTRGKSTPDLLRLRAGDGSDSPDAVVRPADHEEVAALIAWCEERHVALVPFGGGTSVVGGLVARREGFAGVVSLDLVRFDRLLAVDTDSMTATLEPGLRGPQAEALLAEHGLTLGHFPQSFEYASIGGFAVTRSSGQSSAGYGRFDSMVVGLRVATPRGELSLGHLAGQRRRTRPARGGDGLRGRLRGGHRGDGARAPAARGQGLRDLALGLLRRRRGGHAHPRPGRRAARPCSASPTRPRPRSTWPSPPRSAAPASGGCLMVTGFEGTQEAVDAKRAAVTSLLAGLGGTSLGEDEGWASGRFHGPYLRDSLLDVGVLVETVETVTFWSRLSEVYDAVKAALTASLGEATLVLCHISHVYETGASLYFTVAAKQTDDPVAQWLAAKAAASDAMIDHGASITHHHAVGQDHKPWLAREIGPVGVRMLRALKPDLDPAGVLNPGVLIP